MRARWVVVALGCAAVPLGVACSSFTSDVGATEDAGTEDQAAERTRAPNTDGTSDVTQVGTDAQASGCPGASTLLGRFMTYQGKVNVHTPLSAAVTEREADERNGWYPDPDCTTGADVRDLGYCKVFWPTSTTVVGPVDRDLDAKPYYTAGCGQLFDEDPGEDTFLCCGPRE